MEIFVKLCFVFYFVIIASGRCFVDLNVFLMYIYTNESHFVQYFFNKAVFRKMYNYFFTISFFTIYIKYPEPHYIIQITNNHVGMIFFTNYTTWCYHGYLRN